MADKRKKAEKNPIRTVTTNRKGSRHKPRKMIAFEPRIYTLLKQLAEQNNRPLSWEARLMAIQWLSAAGLWTPPQAI